MNDPVPTTDSIRAIMDHLRTSKDPIQAGAALAQRSIDANDVEAAREDAVRLFSAYLRARVEARPVRVTVPVRDAQTGEVLRAVTRASVEPNPEQIVDAIAGFLGVVIRNAFEPQHPRRLQSVPSDQTKR